MTDPLERIIRPIVEGPRVDPYHSREIPEHQWTKCDGCPMFRVFDFHYFYCRYLGDQSKPDEWNAGWKRINPVHNEAQPAPCGLNTVTDLPNRGDVG